MPKTKNQTVDTVIVIHGVPLETHKVIYEVVGKYDADAPDGFKNNQTTKLLDDAAGKNTISVGFDSMSNLWDTGLYEDSPMYAGLDEDTKQNLIKQINTLIVEPFEKIYGKGKLDPRDPDSNFWNYVDKNKSFKVDLYKGRIFNTEKPLDLLQLFICVANKDLAPKKFESNPLFLKAQFCIDNQDEVRTTKIENDRLDMKATGTFYSMLNQPKTLEPVLHYIGLKNIKVKNEDVAISMFKRFIDNKEQSYQNKKLFLEAVDLSSTPKGFKEILYYMHLDKLMSKGALVKLDGEFVIEEVKIGNNLKAAAKKVAEAPKLQQKIDEMISKE